MKDDHLKSGNAWFIKDDPGNIPTYNIDDVQFNLRWNGFSIIQKTQKPNKFIEILDKLWEEQNGG